MSLVVKREPDFPFQTGAQNFTTYDQNLLFPVSSGNPNRVFNSPNYHEMIAGVAQVMTEEYEKLTLITNTSVLTAMWPKIKLAEGVRVIRGSVRTYNHTPFTAVPQRGTVRFMSESVVQYSLAISQKGIGARIHGSVLQSPAGPAEVARHTAAFAESANITMALLTAVGIVNTAFQNSLLSSKDASFATNYGQKISRDLEVYASMGAHPNRLTQLLERELRSHPELDSVLLPDGADMHLSPTVVQATISVPIYAHRDGQFMELQAKQTISSLAQIKGGSVSVFEMPIVSLYARNRTMQVLESEIVIGEVYIDETLQHYGIGEGRQYTPKEEDIVIYDQPADTFRKIRFNDAIAHCYIWNPQSADYHPSLLNFVNTLQKTTSSKDNDNYRIPLQYPVARDETGNYYLPEFIGNLSQEHLSDELLGEMIECGINALTVGVQNKQLFAEAKADHQAVKHIREAIESLPYSDADFEAIAKANINRSVTNDGRGGVIFSGERTPARRTHTDSMAEPLIEWAPNQHGGLDLPGPDANPLGMFNAAGLRTLSYSNHPLSRDAGVAYSFLEALAGRIQEIYPDNPMTNTAIMTPNFHRDDPVQTILDGMFGQRMPLFLAAPSSLATRPSGTLPSTVKTRNGYGISSDAGIEELKDKKIIETPSGILFAVDKNAQANVAAQSFVDTFAAENGTILWFKGLMEDANVDPDMKGKLIRAFVKKLISASKRSTQSSLIQAFYGLVFNITDLSTFNEAATMYFLNGIPKDQGQRATFSAGFKALQKVLPDGDEDKLLRDLAEKTRASQYQSLPREERERVDRSSEDYESLVGSLERLAIALRGADLVDEKTSLFWAPDGVIVEGASNLQVLASGSDDQIVKDLVALIKAELGEYGNAIGISTLPFIGEGDADGRDLIDAVYYRAPLTATMKIAEDIRDRRLSWVHLADPDQAFNDYVRDLPARFEDLVENYSFLTNTENGAENRVRGDGVDIFFESSRVSLHDYESRGVNQGLMNRRLAMVRREYPTNSVKRLIGVTILLTSHKDLRAIRSLINSGIVPPFSLTHWRLMSKGLFGDIIIMKKGRESGVNLHNNARILAAIDNVRNDVQLRATIDTDAHPIRPQNHILVGPAQPRAYIGGHNAEIVSSPGQLLDGNDEYRPSVISTVVPRGHMESRLYPISFVNRVPAMIDRQTGRPADPNPNRQYWSGGHYYGGHIYRDYFNDDEIARYDGVTDRNVVFDDHSLERNHLAFRGFHGRLNHGRGDFSREVVGNGHRDDPRYNSPGARDYFNMASYELRTRSTLADAAIY